MKLDDLGRALTTADPQKAVVWYYRENAAGEPPPVAQQVIQKVIDARLPISFSSKADFSDVVDPETGQSRPRK
jgi:hypothetical protein